MNILGKYFLVFISFTSANQTNDINVYDKLNKKNNEINGRPFDWIGIDDATLDDIIAKLRNVVIAFKKIKFNLN